MWFCSPGRSASLLHASQTHANRSASSALWSHTSRSPAASHLRETTAPRAHMVTRAEGIAPIINGACGLQGRRRLVLPSTQGILWVLLLLLAGFLEVCGLVLLVVMPASRMPARHMPTAAPRVHCGATPHEAPRSPAASHLGETTAP